MIKLYLLAITIISVNSEEITTTPALTTTLHPVTANNTTHKEVPQQKLPVQETKKSAATSLAIEAAPILGPKKLSSTAWNINAVYAESNLTEAEDSKSDYKEDKVEKNEMKEFRPSQHLGSFFDEEKAEVIKKPIFGSYKKPAVGFISSPPDVFYPAPKKPPPTIYQTHQAFPYKFESPIYTQTKGNWLFQDSIDSRPTVEIPVKIPTGGFYKSPEAFKDGPLSAEEFALDGYGYGKENGVKRRSPWKSLLQLMTAFLPVGLIISALTPSVITIESTGTNTPYPKNPFRRSDPGAGLADVAPISEECRRRLLCELHSESNYMTSPAAPRKKKRCYKIHCEDLHALWRTLRWLLAQHRPGADDQRARTNS